MRDGPAVSEEVKAFLESGEVAIWLATASVENIPQTTRAMGACVDRERRMLQLYVPSEQGARALANVRDGAKLAATFVRVTDYRAVQVKGVIAICRPCDKSERHVLESYRERFANTSERVGMPRELITNLTYWPNVVLEVSIEELFAQTPGPNAGARL